MAYILFRITKVIYITDQRLGQQATVGKLDRQLERLKDTFIGCIDWTLSELHRFASSARADNSESRVPSALLP